MRPVTAETLQDLEKFLEDAATAWQKSHPSMDRMSVTIQATVRSEASGEIWVRSGFTTKGRPWRLVGTELSEKDYAKLTELAKASSKPWIRQAINQLVERKNQPALKDELFPDVHSYEPREAANLWLKTQGALYRFVENKTEKRPDTLIQLGFGR